MKQHIVRIAALGLSTTAIVGVGSAFSPGYAATAECTAVSPKLVETIAAVTHTESRYAKTVPGAHHDAVTRVVHHEAETHEEVAPGGYAFTQRSTGKVEFKDSESWNPGKGWFRTPSLDKMITVVDKAAYDEEVVDVAAYDEPDTVVYYTGKPAGSTSAEDAAWVRYAPTGWPTKVDTRTITDVPEAYVCDFVKPVTTLLNPTPLVRPGFVFDLQTTDDHAVAKTVGNIYRDGALFKSFQSAGGSLSVPANLPDGAYTLRYNGLDSVGNVATTSTYDFVVDGTAPTVTDKGTAGAAAQSKSFKLFDARRVDKVTINGVTKDLTNSVWSDINDIRPGRYGAVEGKNTLVAYDEAGNASAPVEFILDTTGPEITDKGAAGKAGQSKSFKLHDPRRVDKVTINGVTKDLTNNVWSDVNDIKPGRYGAVEGENTLVAYDELGNTTEITFILDQTGPTVTVKDEAPAISRSKSFKLYDRFNVDKVTINGVVKDLTNNTWSDVNDVKPGRFGAVEGKNTLIAYDEAGNASEAVEFVLDTTGPAITEKPGSSETNRSFKLDDGVLGSKVAGVRVNGKDFPLSENRWSDVNDLRLGNWWGVQAGENTLVAYDGLGNETTVTFTVAAPAEEAPATDGNSQAEVEPEAGGQSETGSGSDGEGAENGAETGIETDTETGNDAETGGGPTGEAAPQTEAAPVALGGNSVGTPSDAGPVATSPVLAGPRSAAATAFAPELVFEAAGMNTAPQGEGRRSEAKTTAELIADPGQVETVDTIQAAASAPAPIDESLPGLGIAITAGGAMVAFGAALGMRRRRRS
ncbi:hypothetical protein J2S40_001691 [Nocardioides luteus]|uniref:Gram-positive cocci surface proteins LPxTG domain-containing protein n=1 Tax=Nocardioides luteus TaxID=1844 RepID=A0ABQ5T1H6_9ACTN|nr:hypothetical protein [Nocardioides luteus]MDR7310633.1 hypothetical protein [Nocardioides luteus]GGR41653.1 hypothetical protein GCM10010197_03630 [Nocardioides luteus]GLJ69587.1 hypothetical protein GCM10017579_36230 [Nocardioides luteus]